MSLSRRDFLTTLSVSLCALTLASGLRAEDAGPAFAPTPDDGLGDAIKDALAAGRKQLLLGDGVYGPQTVRGISGNGLEIVGTGRSVLDMTMIADSSRLRFRNVIFQGVKSDLGSGQGLAYVNRDASDIAFDNCHFRTAESTAGWSPQDWVEKPYSSGLLARGKGITVRGSTFSNLRNCLTFLDSDDGVAEKCTFTDFGNDAIEFGGNNMRITGNVIRGSHHTDTEKQHSDGIQGFPAPDDGTYSNIEISANDIEFVGPGDYMQGISIFDGRWKDLRIVDNQVKVNMWNAIAVFGADGVLIEGNTVVSRDRKRGSWIQVRASKSGRSSTNITVRRNRAPTFKIPPGARMERNI